MLPVLYLVLLSSPYQYLCSSPAKHNPSSARKSDNIISREFRYDYTYYEELGGWLKLQEVPATWHQARARCKLEGAELASPHNTSMLHAIIKQMSFRGINMVSTGIHSLYTYGYYFSMKGVPLDRMPVTWVRGGPSSDKDQRIVGLLNDGKVINYNGANMSYPFFCYKQDRGESLTRCGTFDEGYQYMSELDKCYKFHTVGKTWEDAFMTCAAEGAYLTIINNDEEHTSLIELFKEYREADITGKYSNYAHIGFNDFEHSGQWFTIHGDTLQEAGFSTWAYRQIIARQLNNSASEFCGSLRRDGGLNDSICSDKLAFICEKNKDSLAIEVLDPLDIDVSLDVRFGV